MLTITEAAQARIDLITAGGRDLRISVRSGGCAGYTYSFQIAGEGCPRSFPDDTRLGKVLIDSMSFALIDGATLDYEESPTTSRFFFHKPNAKTCGCGASFAQ